MQRSLADSGNFVIIAGSTECKRLILLSFVRHLSSSARKAFTDLVASVYNKS